MVKFSKIIKHRTIKYVIIGLAIGIIISVGYYFFDYQNKPEEEVGVSKEKVLLADQNQYDLDVVLNSIISNQIVLQNLIKSLEERIIIIEEQIINEQKNDNN